MFLRINLFNECPILIDNSEGSVLKKTNTHVTPFGKAYMAAPDRMEVAHLRREEVSTSLELEEFAALAETLNVQRVMSALAAEEFDWRTLDGLERSTRLPGATIVKIIEANAEKIESKESEQFGIIFRRKDFKMAATRGILSRLDKVLDYMSFGARRIAKP